MNTLKRGLTSSSSPDSKSSYPDTHLLRSIASPAVPVSDALGPASSGFARSTVCVDQVIRKASKTIDRFSNLFQKKYSKRDQSYSQAANLCGQYIELSGLSLIPHFCLLFFFIYSSYYITSIYHELHKRGGFDHNDLDSDPD